MLPELGTKKLQEYLKEIGKSDRGQRHKFYTQSVEHMKEMGVHVTGDDPKKLLDIKRPNENKEARQYRLDSYKAKTKASASRAGSIINRIYNERLFSITFKEDPSGLIDKDESLQKYLNDEMPIYVSLMNYIKTVFTRMHLKDANAVLGILPTNFDNEDDTTIFTPIPIFYNSNEVVDFKDEEYYTILRGGIKEKNSNKSQEIIIYTKDQILVFFREKNNDDFNLKLEYNHNFGIPPAFRVGGVVVDAQPPQLFESFIAGVLPHWDDAVAMFSDLSFAIVNHLYPKEWEIPIDCNAKGCQNGEVTVKGATGDSTKVKCTICSGTGRTTSRGPSNIHWVNKDALNPDAPLPLPPFGYGEKELGSTELLVKLAEAEIQKGFAAINMDIVNESGENQSGIAKVIDRQDLDGFLGSYADHIFRYVLPNTIFFIEMWRYWEVFEHSEDKINEYFPDIKGPTTFDVFSITLLTDEFSKLAEAGVGGTFLLGLQKDIIEKRFSDEFSKNFFNTVIDVDPIAHLTGDDIMTQGRVIGQTEMYIHTYSKGLVEEAQNDDEKFLSKPLQEKKEIIRALAEEKQKEQIKQLSQVPPEIIDNVIN